MGEAKASSVQGFFCGAMSKYIIHPQMTLMTQIILDYYTRLDLNYLRNPRMKNQEATL